MHVAICVIMEIVQRPLQFYNLNTGSKTFGNNSYIYICISHTFGIFTVKNSLIFAHAPKCIQKKHRSFTVHVTVQPYEKANAQRKMTRLNVFDSLQQMSFIHNLANYFTGSFDQLKGSVGHYCTLLFLRIPD